MTPDSSAPSLLLFLASRRISIRRILYLPGIRIPMPCSLLKEVEEDKWREVDSKVGEEQSSLIYWITDMIRWQGGHAVMWMG